MQGYRFVIDTSRCTGCGACYLACKDRADLPDGLSLIRLETVESGRYPNVCVVHRIVHCYHCSQPQCVDVCPTEALTRGEDGLVRLAEEQCIGCGNCIEACPWRTIEMGPDGTAIKCDGCEDELALGWEPTCVRACPMRALGFTLAADGLPAGKRAEHAFDAAGIGPRVLYLVRQSAR